MIKINIEKAKNIAHEHRRIARSKEFEPYDNSIAKQIPGEVEGAEAQRALIRTKYEGIQNQINEAASVEELKTIIDNL